MKFVFINGNPKKDGLCHSVFEEAVRGALEGGAEAEIVDTIGIDRCRVCGNGWGSCGEDRGCAFGGDGFDKAKETVSSADLLCIITPVYWHEMAEGVKSFIDRLRRCERGEDGALANKPVLLIASAGGTGNGIINCLHQMEQFCRHTQLRVFDFIGVNRWNADYKREAAFSAAKAMAEGRSPDDTI